MHFRKMNHHFPTRLFQFSIAGCQSLSWQFRAEGGNPPWTGCRSVIGCITHSPLSQTGGNADMPFHVTCTSWVMRGKQSTWRKPTQKCQLYTDCGPGWELIFFSYQCCHERKLFEVQLYLI